MSTLGGPKIVTSGLVYAADAADPFSFRGEPTTNLMPTITSWSDYVTSPTNQTVYDFPNSIGSPKTVKQSIGSSTVGGGGNYGGFFRSGVSSVVVSGETVTVSFWVRSLSGNMTCTLSNQSGAGDASNLSFTFTATSEWRRVTNTATLNLSKDQFYIWNSSIASGRWQIADFQLEKKSYATTYTEGTRGTTTATGGGFTDITGNGINGTLVNNPKESSERSGCIVFDGTDDHISLPSIVLGNTFTIGSFVRMNSTATEGCIYGSDANGQDNWFSIYGDRVYLFATQSSDVNNTAIIGTTLMSTSSWYHAAATINGNTMKVYLNGVEEATLTAAFNFGAWNSTGAIGRRGSVAQRYFNGSIANIHMFNRVLSITEIRSLYSSMRGRFGA